MAQKYNYYRPEDESSKLGDIGAFVLGLTGGGTVGSSIGSIMEEKRRKRELGRERRHKRDVAEAEREYKQQQEATEISDKAILEKRKLEESRKYKEGRTAEERRYKERRAREPKPPKEPDWGKELTAINKNMLNAEEVTPEMIDLRDHATREYYKSINYIPPYRPPLQGEEVPINENNLPKGKMTEMPPEFVQAYLDFYNNDPIKAKEEAEKNGWIIPED